MVVVDPTTLPAGYTQTGDPEANHDNQGAATVSGGSSVLTMDFGYKPPAGAYSVSGTVWNDNGAGGGGAGNGIQDGTEPGIPNVTVCLYDSAGTISLVCTTTNASRGLHLPRLGEWDLRGQGGPDYPAVDGIRPDRRPGPDQGQQDDRSLSAAPTSIDQDFGYREILGSISGTVCEGNGDGLCDAGRDRAGDHRHPDLRRA